jgi:hypothetical protein
VCPFLLVNLVALQMAQLAQTKRVDLAFILDIDWNYLYQVLARA